MPYDHSPAQGKKVDHRMGFINIFNGWVYIDVDVALVKPQLCFTFQINKNLIKIVNFTVFNGLR